MKIVQRRYKVDHDKNIRSDPKPFYARQYVYIGCPPLKTSAAERLATGSYCKLVSQKLGPFRIVENWPSTATIDEDGILKTVSIDRKTLAPTSTTVQDVMEDGSIRDEDGLPTEAMRKNVHKTYEMPQKVVYDKLGQDAM